MRKKKGYKMKNVIYKLQDFYDNYQNVLLSEACLSVGHKGHIALINQNRRAYAPPPSKNGSDEIRNGMFLPSVKKAFFGGIGGRRYN